jgi:hypothetical protein
MHLVHILHLGNIRNDKELGEGEEGWFSRIEGGKSVKDLKNLLMAILQIDFSQQNCDHNAICREDNRKL